MYNENTWGIKVFSFCLLFGNSNFFTCTIRLTFLDCSLDLEGITGKYPPLLLKNRKSQDTIVYITQTAFIIYK